MQQLIGIELSATTSESHFTLDERVLKVRELFTQPGLAQVVGRVLPLLDELLALRPTTGQPTPPRLGGCGQHRYELKDRLDRELRTRVGRVTLRWRRLACTHCGQTWCPLREFLGLARWQRKSVELERVAVGSVNRVTGAAAGIGRWRAKSPCPSARGIAGWWTVRRPTGPPPRIR